MNPARTLFIVASKSGGTVEVASMERFFWTRMSAALGADAGRHFVAITDPAPASRRLREQRGYREVFMNPPDIGGRFSALSLFGLVPAALIGAPVQALLVPAPRWRKGAASTITPIRVSSWARSSRRRRAKAATSSPSPCAQSCASLGLWIEQLVAESTGKHGQGRRCRSLTNRWAVRTSTARIARSSSVATDVRRIPTTDALERARSGRPSGAAPFHAASTALAPSSSAGSSPPRSREPRSGINPFDEPNVSEAKEKTKALLAGYAERRPLRRARPPSGAARRLTAVRGVSARIHSDPGDYVAFLSYLPAEMDVENGDRGHPRGRCERARRSASTFGVGPRYLHSTGQYHKGGPNTCVAFVLTADDETETRDSGGGLSFAVLKRAQALGDVQALAGARPSRAAYPPALQ